MMRGCYWCNGIGLLFNYDRGPFGEWETCDVCAGSGEIDDPDLEDEEGDDDDGEQEGDDDEA